MLRNRKGFTLVEVVVVLVILGILAAVMIPALTGWIDDARKTECRSKMGMVARDYHTWVADYGYGLVTPVAGNEATLLNSAVTDILNRAATGGNTYTCPYGGNCTVTFSKDSLAVTQITCSLHGTVVFGAGGGAMAAMTDQEIGDALATFVKSGKALPNANIYGVGDNVYAGSSPKQSEVDTYFASMRPELRDALKGSYWTIKRKQSGTEFELYFFSKEIYDTAAANPGQTVESPVFFYDSVAPEKGLQPATKSIRGGTTTLADKTKANVVLVD